MIYIFTHAFAIELFSTYPSPEASGPSGEEINSIPLLGIELGVSLRGKSHY
jgi:hypothetical protein